MYYLYASLCIVFWTPLPIDTENMLFSKFIFKVINYVIDYK